MEVVGLARDGVDGLSVINETNPDIVILDMTA
jgi:YesN/AraC family two-component response regulator